MRATYLAHHGVLGQKWGIRKYQNEDGSYTAQGEGRYHDTRESRPKVKIDPEKAYWIKTGAEYAVLALAVLGSVAQWRLSKKGMSTDATTVGREIVNYAVRNLR